MDALLRTETVSRWTVEISKVYSCNPYVLHYEPLGDRQAITPSSQENGIVSTPLPSTYFFFEVLGDKLTIVIFLLRANQ